MTFRVGQKVVCVDDSDSRLGPTSVVRNVVYTVAAVFLWRDDVEGIQLIEVRPARSRIGFFARRFRPAVESKTDISVLKALLVPSKQGADA
jgi:hypothetical protein